MEIKAGCSIHNKFEVVVTDSITGKVKQKETAYNIVLNQMYTRLCGGSSYFTHIHFGTGIGTPEPGRTSLFTYLGNKPAIDEEVIKAVPVSRWKRKIVLNPEEFVGQNISEIGIAYGTGSTNLVTHAMLKDSEGNPITILKTDTDVITIYATVFVTFTSQYENLKYIKLGTNGNSLINYLVGGGGAPTGSFGLNVIPNAYQRLGSTPSVAWVSDTVNRQRKTSVARFGIDAANGNVLVLDFSNVFEIRFPQVGLFMGQSYAGINIGLGDSVKKEFEIPSAYVNQNSIAIKVDGVTNTGFVKTVKNINIERVNAPDISITNIAYDIALTPDGLIMAIAHNGAPYVSTYDRLDNVWVKRPDPDILPPGVGEGIALTPDGSVMAVAHSITPFVTTYDWIDNAWVKRPDPANLPTGLGQGIALTPDGLLMVVAHSITPFVTTYDWIDNAWVKRPDPVSLPVSTTQGIALTPDGLIMAVAHYSSPYVTTYDWIDNAWVKRPEPSIKPSSTGRYAALTPDGSVMAVAHYFSPYVTTYDWIDNTWVKRPDPDIAPTGNGAGVALTPDGLLMAVTHKITPYVSIYDWIDGAWVKRPNPASLPPGDSEGVALTPDGSVMAVGHGGLPYVTTYRSIPNTVIKFDTPPPSGAVITADYTVEGVHKTNQYVIDVSFAIQFGEGV